MSERQLSPETVLIADDEQIVRSTLVAQVTEEGYRAVEASRLGAVRLDDPAPSLVLLDLQLPDGNGIDFLPRLRQHWPDTPVIVMTGHGTIESAVQAMQLGAHTYVQKPFHFDELSLTMRQAIEASRMRRRVEDDLARNAELFSFERIVARSDAMKRAVDQARIIAASPATSVLLLGESGTGKGLLASTLHYASGRSAAPFLKVTCSAIPEPLLEAEMFGHEQGAFTDAKKRRRGIFEAADRGTVFLDEIGDMPAALQAKLLGVLEDRSFSRVGGSRRVEVDVRVISATHRDLDRAVAQTLFREDLFYRLDVARIVIPALRDRREDIIPLAETFLGEFNREFHREVEGFDDTAREFLTSHYWRGNVRELRNVLERALLFSHAPVLTAHDLMLDRGYRPHPTAAPGEPGEPAGFTLPADGVSLDKVEQELVRQAMQRAKNNQSRAAALLGITRDQMRYRLDKMGLLPKRRAT